MVILTNQLRHSDGKPTHFLILTGTLEPTYKWASPMEGYSATYSSEIFSARTRDDWPWG